MFDVEAVRYRHLGVTTEDGVDLKAEVGLLSRNIRIHGEMEESCYADNLCDYFNYDTFGGHIQVRSGVAGKIYRGEGSLAQDDKGLDWITLSRSCLKSGCPSTSIIVVSRGLCLSLINERRDRLKASVLLNGGHFER